jgi:hypothetical protein
MLLVLHYERMYAFRFDAAGRYRGRLERAMAPPQRPEPPTEPSPRRRAEVLAWAKELGLRPATIRVRKFESEYDEPYLAIYDHPTYFETGDMGSDEEREETLRWWHDVGAFVLWFEGEQYWLDGQGQPCG